ncbi:MAG: hypothetical protein CFE45_13250 [Burkholderiales bacterium PBB5]|nr:MAG: hypothetical protein CFE45_13250 [Burkholderiales bacterium PBB5]
MSLSEIDQASFDGQVAELRGQIAALDHNPAYQTVLRNKVSNLFAERYGTAPVVTGGGMTYSSKTGEVLSASLSAGGATSFQFKRSK